MDAHHPRGPSRLTALRRRWLAPLVLAAAVFAVYGNALGNGFVWDDEHLIVLDSRLVDDTPISALFSTDFFGHREEANKYGYYRPLVTLSYLIERRIFGLAPWGYHLVNLLAHLGCALAVLALGRRLFEGREGVAFAGALLFAVHPVHTESVTWISGRTDVLATLAVLLGLLVHDRFAGDAIRRRVIGVVAACLMLGLALLSKEVALGFPLIVFLWDRRRLALRPAVLRSLPYVGVAGAYLAARFLWLAVDANPLPPIAPHHWALTAGLTLWRYLGELLWPVPLSAYLVNPWLVEPDWRWIVGAAGIVAAIAAGVFLRRRQPAGFLFLAFLAALAPMSNLGRISAPFEMGFAMAERFLYLPSVFACLGIGYLLIGLIEKRWVGRATVGVLVVAAGVVTIARNPDWRDNRALFTVSLEQQPDSYHLLGWVAADHLRSGRLSLAEEHYRKALASFQRQTGDDHPQFATSLALTLVQRGRHSQALAIAAPLERVVTESPTLAYVVGEAHRKLEQLDEAEGAFVRCLTQRKDYYPARLGLALVASSRGDHERALRFYESVRELDVELPIVHEAMGDMHRRMGRIEAAVAEFEKAIEQNPGSFTAHGALGSIRAKQGEFEEAVRHYRRALELNPEFHEATVALAMIDAERGDVQAAERAMLGVLADEADNKAALLNLAILDARQGRIGRARKLLETLLALEPRDRRARQVLEQIDSQRREEP